MMTFTYCSCAGLICMHAHSSSFHTESGHAVWSFERPYSLWLQWSGPQGSNPDLYWELASLDCLINVKILLWKDLSSQQVEWRKICSIVYLVMAQEPEITHPMALKMQIPIFLMRACKDQRQYFTICLSVCADFNSFQTARGIFMKLSGIDSAYPRQSRTDWMGVFLVNGCGLVIWTTN